HDRAFLDALDRFPAPVVIAVGDLDAGLTERQLEFQRSFLAGRLVGSAEVRTTDGVVRYLHARKAHADGHVPTLVGALAAALGVEPPAEPLRLYYRPRATGGPPVVRRFRATDVALLPQSWLEGRVVMLGADLPNQDRFRTPLSVLGGADSAMAGLEIHARALA